MREMHAVHRYVEVIKVSTNNNGSSDVIRACSGHAGQLSSVSPTCECGTCKQLDVIYRNNELMLGFALGLDSVFQ